MIEFTNELSPAEAERLALLIEELGEAAQAAGKILRHGYNSYHPDRPMGGSNRDSLEKELGDVRFCIELLCVSKDVGRLSIAKGIAYKARGVARWLHHQDQKILRRIQEEWLA